MELPSKMKTLIGIIIIAVSVAIGYPLLNEDASNVCSALERRLIILESQREGNQAATALLVALQNSLSNGSFAMSFVKLQHSDLPPVVGCTLTYWHTLLNPVGTSSDVERAVEREQDDAQHALDRARDAQRAMRALSGPATPLPANPGRAPSYKPGDRRDMNRLFENAR
jgi:hypothetical protein